MLDDPQPKKRRRKAQAAPEPLVPPLITPNLRDSRAPGPLPAPARPRRVTLAAFLAPPAPLQGAPTQEPALRRRARRRR
ncbi:hypothetical protein [Deinococcus multiflagellatus]|uniref:Uncharacterized protein n=1 Tax=Deinococcus multiflagellatus TaxID=1656887 RepID=A0ABW1ZNS8_9DEIO|nr:hypothetical protein [Deinococcus multiflagellatus]MBZ9714015.1 hypothetical protein [Deinococcus multiflagellatus]